MPPIVFITAIENFVLFSTLFAVSGFIVALVVRLAILKREIIRESKSLHQTEIKVILDSDML